MTDSCKEKLASAIRDFHLPRYHEIPTVGLYLEQVTKYICEYLAPLEESCITNSMISNYVKKRLIDNPVKKQYSRDQIAYLFFIAVAKNVLSLGALEQFIQLQKQTYSTERAYNYFCDEMENILAVVFGMKPTPDTVGVDSTDEKIMLRSTIVAFCHKIYLEKCFQFMSEETEQSI